MKKKIKTCEFYAFAIVGGGYDRCHAFRTGLDGLNHLVEIVEAIWPENKLTRSDKEALKMAPESSDNQVYLRSIDMVLQWTKITMDSTDTLHFVSCEYTEGDGDSGNTYILNMDLKKYKDFLLETTPQIKDSVASGDVKFEDLAEICRFVRFYLEDDSELYVETQEIYYLTLDGDEYWKH